MNWEQLENFASDKDLDAVKTRVKDQIGFGFDPMGKMSVDGVHAKLKHRGWVIKDQKKLKGGKTKKTQYAFEHKNMPGYKLNYTAHLRGEDPIYHHIEVVKE